MITSPPRFNLVFSPQSIGLVIFEVRQRLLPSFQASFIKRGATLTSFWDKDKKGVYRELSLSAVLKTAVQYNYATDTPYFDAVMGRYANRVRNGALTILGPSKTRQVMKQSITYLRARAMARGPIWFCTSHRSGHPGTDSTPREGLQSSMTAFGVFFGTVVLICLC